MSNTKPNQITVRSTAVNGLPIPEGQSLVPLLFYGDRIMVEPIPPDEFMDEAKTIKKPVSYKEPYIKGKVMSIGGGEYGIKIPEGMVAGQVIYYLHQTRMEFDVAGVKYDVVRVSDIISAL